MPTINVKAGGGQPLFDIASYGRNGPGRRDRLSPTEVALISRTVHGAPEVMVKVLNRGATTVSAVRQHIGYIGRDGGLVLETDDGERLRDEVLAQSLPEQWDLDLDQHRRQPQLMASDGRKPARLVHKLMLSMPAGTRSGDVLRAARHFLREEFGSKHRYAFVMHTDVPHPHVHAIVKAIGEQGVRLRIDKATLHRWRQHFAACLRAEGIEANATSRVVRGQSRASKLDSIVRAARRGDSTHMRRRVQDALHEIARGDAPAESGKRQLLETRRYIEAGWLGLSQMLQSQGHAALAAEVRRFVKRMPPARTEKEWLAHELLSRAHATRAIEMQRSR